MDPVDVRRDHRHLEGEDHTHEREERKGKGGKDHTHEIQDEVLSLRELQGRERQKEKRSGTHTLSGQGKERIDPNRENKRLRINAGKGRGSAWARRARIVPEPIRAPHSRRRGEPEGKKLRIERATSP